MKKYLIYIFTSIVIIILAGGFYCWYQFYMPVSSQTNEKEFLIEKGTGTRKITTDLKDAGLIRSASCFNLYVWLRGFHHSLQAGQYVLNPNFSTKKIAEVLASGETYQPVVKITIPEGFTNEQISKRLSGAEFKEKISIIDDNLQGFLFPDTYFFSPEADVDEVVKKMLDNFQTRVNPELRKEIAAQGRTLDDILKMASLLEKEVKSEEDRKIAAGIFWQRLGIGQPLESCATIAYILGEEKPRYSFEETRTSSPYNTYLHLGLPPKPINNPGLAAIIAAIYPKESPYNYFLTDPENGQTIFAKTIEEHQQNKVKYFK